MKNLLCAELYKLKVVKTIHWLTIVSAAIGLFFVFTQREKNVLDILFGDILGSRGLSRGTSMPSSYNVLPLIFIASFSSLPINLDFGKKLDAPLPVKNILARGFSPFKIYFSKLLVGFTMVIFSLVIQTISALIFGSILLSGFGELPHFNDAIFDLLSTILSYISFTCTFATMYLFSGLRPGFLYYTLSYLIFGAQYCMVLLPSALTLEENVRNVVHLSAFVGSIVAIAANIGITVWTISKKEIK